MNGMNVILSVCVGAVPSNLGVRDGRLSPCSDSPNCVSSQSTDPDHGVFPITYASTAVDAFTDLKIILGQMKRVRIVKESPTYLHVTFTSFLFRFVDDVEFALDDVEKLIHIRSASRTGKNDLGVNRKRVEKIRELWKNR